MRMLEEFDMAVLEKFFIMFGSREFSRARVSAVCGLPVRFGPGAAPQFPVAVLRDRVLTPPHFLRFAVVLSSGPVQVLL